MTELVHGANDRRAKDEKLGVFVRGIARVEEVSLRRVAEREVDVLARPVDAREGLFVQEAREAELFGDPLEHHHDELLVVGRHVPGLEHRRELELARRNLVVPRFRRNPELEELVLGGDHER